MTGERIDLEKGLPTKLALDVVIILPLRASRRAQVMLKLEVLAPTAVVPTEPPEETSDPSVAAALQNISAQIAGLQDMSKDVAGLRTACEGSWDCWRNKRRYLFFTVCQCVSMCVCSSL